MEFFKMFANLPDLPAVIAADDAEIGSLGLLVQCMCYCTSSGSPGLVPDGKMSRFGGARLAERTEALAAEGLLIRGDRGWQISPEAWCEERNLNDTAERKREADRKRMQARRAAERDKPRDGAANQTETPSRDSRATGRATPSRDSRALEVEVDKDPPPTPPGPSRAARPATERAITPLWPAAVTPEEGEGDDDDHDDELAALVVEIRGIRAEWSIASIRRALADERVRDRPWPLVHAAALAVARDPSSQQPGRLAHDGPWWIREVAAPQAARPDHCGACDPGTRLTLTDPPRRCPACHPLAREAS